jgi:Protein of unknown function (DUF2750)
MHQDTIVVRQRHKKFIEKICETTIVYGLESDEGFASSSSNSVDDENDEPIKLICFWSEKAWAKSCMKNDWAVYELKEISLSEFIENWCVGMSNDQFIVGTNFDQNMFGYEAEPLELILDLVKELRNIKSEIKFLKFSNLDDLEEQIKGAME